MWAVHNIIVFVQVYIIYSLLLTRFSWMVVQGKQCYQHNGTEKGESPHSRCIDQLVARLSTEFYVCECVGVCM